MKSDDPSAGETFIADLLVSLPDDNARRAAREVLRGWKGTTIYVPALVDREERARTLRQIVAAGLSNEAAIPRLVQRFGVGDRQARRLLGEARRESKGSGPKS